jgi:hypothetical protein
MHGLSPATIRLANPMEPPDPSNLPVRTLVRGARAGLPSGQEAAEALLEQGLITAQDLLAKEELTRDTCDRSGSVLRQAGLEQNTPLFYYLLKEAELRAEGLTLGPVGSYIVSEAIQGSLESDPDGYMALAGKKWEMPLWKFPSGARRPITSLIGIIRLIGDDKLLPECDAHRRKFLL